MTTEGGQPLQDLTSSDRLAEAHLLFGLVTIPPPFELLEELLGCRTDDPRLVELHGAYGLRPPPMFDDRNGMDAFGEDDLGWELSYQATVRVPGSYPSVRVNGRGAVLGYLTKVWIQESYEPSLPGGVTTATPEPEVRERALETRVAEYGNVVHILRRDERSTLEVRYHEDGRFIWCLLTLNERAEDDPDLLRAADAALASAPASRVIPSWPEPGMSEHFPAVLLALHNHQRANGFGELDFEVYDRFESGGPAAWIGNPAAKREFRVFGGNASGGLAAFWLVHEGRPIEEQPVVFLESEGDVGPIAADLCDLIYLLAGGIGPFEALMYGDSWEDVYPQPSIAGIAETYLVRREGRTPAKILAEAEAEYSDIKDRIDMLAARTA